MKKLVASTLACLFFVLPSTALADEEDHEPNHEPETKKEMVRVEPTGGWVTGRWMGVPLTRVAGGLDAIIMPVPKAPIGIDGTFFVESGSTENGLDAKRVELGAGVTSKPTFFRVMAGGHFSWAWLTRKTMPGSIGGIGIGAHACVEGAIPLGTVVAITVGLRGSADLYDGGIGYEGGPFAGLRF